MLRSLGLALAGALWIGAAAAAPFEERFSGLLVLGDSLSDPGNLFARSAGAFPPSPPYFIGRVSSGPVWAEYLAADFAAAGKPTLNVAHAFARAVPPSEIAPDLPAQLGLAALELGRLGSRPLASLWFGANDLFAGIGTPENLDRAEDAAEATLTGALALGAMGVKDILLFNLPDLSKTPNFALFKTPLAAEPAAATARFNAVLGAGLPTLEAAGLEVTGIDVAALFEEIRADPTPFGLVDPLLPCLFPSAEVAAAFGEPALCDPATAAERLFFDAVHPSGVTHAAIAGAVRAELAPIPLPAALPLLAVALGGLCLVRRRAA